MVVESVDIKAEKRNRNRRIEIDSPLGGDVMINCVREIVLVKDGKRFESGGKYGEKTYIVRKKLADIAGETVKLPDELGGATLSVAQVAAAIEALTDKLASQAA